MSLLWSGLWQRRGDAVGYCTTSPANAEGREQPLVELVEQESPISATLLRSQPASYFMAGGKRH